jgi:hypothetical protein
MFVGSPKDTSQLSHLAGVIHVYIGVAEMQLETVAKIWVLGASLNLGNGIWFEGINTAKSAKSIRILRYLASRPVVFSSNLGVLVRDRRLVWIAILIGERQNKRSSNSCGIQKGNQIACREWLGEKSQFGRRRA